MSDPTLAIRDLKFFWPGEKTPQLDIEDFSISKGDHTLLMGPSGVGKSTFLNLLAGVLGGATGELRILGTDILSLSAAKKDRLRANEIGYIFQRFNLVPYLSVLDNTLLPCRLGPKRAKNIAGSLKAEAERLLGELGLAKSLYHQKASRLSVGQQQRVAAARSLLGAPPLILADEPTSSLDEENQQRFLDTLLDAASKAGSTILLVSHDSRLKTSFDTVVDLRSLNRSYQKGA